MQAHLKIRRYDPESGAPPGYQTFTVDVPDYATVLDALIHIREYVDQSLSLRCSCRSAICGSCAMRINHRARLACKTKITSLTTDSEEIVIEPQGNMPVVKDLVINQQPFWEKMISIEPWLQPTGPSPEREYIVPDEAMSHLAGVMACIMCGACVSDCNSLEIDANFIGPAALAKAYRFVGDPRDGKRQQRLETLSAYSGIYDCTHCFACVEVCPKGIAPMDRILRMRHQAQQAGITDNTGTRHSDVAADSIGHSGWLDETMYLPRSMGLTNVRALLPLIPGAVRLFFKGKVPILHPVIPGVEGVRKIFRKLEPAGRR